MRQVTKRNGSRIELIPRLDRRQPKKVPLTDIIICHNIKASHLT